MPGQSTGHQSLITGGGSWCSAAMVSPSRSRSAADSWSHTVSSRTPGRQLISTCPHRIDPGLSTATEFRLDRQRQAGSCERVYSHAARRAGQISIAAKGRDRADAPSGPLRAEPGAARRRWPSPEHRHRQQRPQRLHRQCARPGRAEHPLPQVRRAVIERDWYRLGTWRLVGDGRFVNCDSCRREHRRQAPTRSVKPGRSADPAHQPTVTAVTERESCSFDCPGLSPGPVAW